MDRGSGLRRKRIVRTAVCRPHSILAGYTDGGGMGTALNMGKKREFYKNIIDRWE